ncbi:DUF2851 family protein [Anditalea andensis]|uniref:DUF2851 domain-containing protein n=1 Tax=Anditalea andensis TaxID=1048983 RepID=A0A074L1J6_9BACT|nr:DUF2851 family protein [Anditalea andensis]KEO73723.1 hypothetical protein EL17_10880 [Anditalea andensis]
MVFQENFLHLVWKYQYFEKTQLTTTDQVPLEIKKIGYHNFHEGPDFFESHIQLDAVAYFGNVEIHLRSSDWNNHHHQHDERYESVILHVVYEHDHEIFHPDGTRIPTLELKGKIYLDVLRNYEKLLNGPNHILCSDSLPETSTIIKFSMLEKALVERFGQKSKLITQLLEDNKGDWEETTYQWLFYSFGFKTNSAAMLELAKCTPYRILKKHAPNVGIIESILLGQADLLGTDIPDEYTSFLLKEYDFYARKYRFDSGLYPSSWKFMGVRPGNFPTVRIAQVASILSNTPNLFSSIINPQNDTTSIKQIFNYGISDYWRHHYRPGKMSKKVLGKTLSSQSIYLLSINFIVPLWYVYGQYVDDNTWQEKCFDLLQEMEAEQNYIIKRFRQIQWHPENAYDSQGMIGLHNNYCLQKKCLECKIGQNLLRPVKK